MSDTVTRRQALEEFCAADGALSSLSLYILEIRTSTISTHSQYSTKVVQAVK